MTSLITRLEQAERGTIELGAAVCEALYFVNLRAQFSACTISLDACRALQEEVLPGSYWTIDGGAPVIVDVFTKHPNAPFEGEHDDECLAWVIAILHAVEAKEAQK